MYVVNYMFICTHTMLAEIGSVTDTHKYTRAAPFATVGNTHTATLQHCNTVATHCNTTAIHFLQTPHLANEHVRMTTRTLQHAQCNTATPLQHTATPLQHIFHRRRIVRMGTCALQHTHCNSHTATLQHNATHCNTLQHTAMHCNTL